MSKRSTKRRHSPPGLPPALHALLQQTRRDKPPCLLCGGDAAVVAFFLPDHPARWGFPPGVHAARVYTLCTACQRRPGKADEAEAVLWRERQQQRQRERQARWN